ncbi:aromatic acid exporter family protein [Microbacterium sp. NPDC089696]|uniref:FUSC family protein n=1 Tax=Microbacterium sp. NPDC089696 TaxID=3364199 RepID=UPI003820F2CF
MRIPAAIRASQRSPLLQVVKSAAATIAAWLLAGWVVPGQLPVFAAIAALLVVQPSINQSLSKALERSIGVIVGVVIAVALGLLLGSPSWIVLLAIVVAMLVAWVFRATPGTGNQVAISAMLVLALGSKPDYALARIFETIIGVVIGIVVNAVIVPPVLVAPARRDLGLLGGELAASLDRLADALPEPQSPAQLQELMLEVRLLRPMKDAAAASISAGEESLTLNPRRSTHRQDLAEMRALLDRLTPIVTQTIGMTRAYFDHYDDTIGQEPAVAAIADQLRRAGHDVRLAVQIADVAREPEALTSAIPALTAPLVIRPPSSDHWILIGSLMEDLRRIREELVDAE